MNTAQALLDTDIDVPIQTRSIKSARPRLYLVYDNWGQTRNDPPKQTNNDANGQTSTFDYNPSGQLTAHTDPQGRTTTYRYDDGLSQPTQRTDPAGHVIRYEYDSERNLTALINENGDKHRFFYDGNERLIKEIGFDGRVQEYAYNPAGHLIQHIDANEVLTAFERDALGQLLAKRSRRITADTDLENLDPEAGWEESAQYRYDALGRLIEATNDAQKVQFQYDPRGNVVTETHASVTEVDNANTTPPLIIQHQVNALGQRTQTTLPDGQVIRYDYDTTLAFKSVSLNDQLISAVQRDSLGREQIRHQGALTTQTEYDPQGRLQRQHAKHKETNFSPIQREYGYDPAGNLNHLKDGHEETNYVYDALNRLKLATAASPEFFDFDPAGNLLSITDTPTATPGVVKGNRLLIQGDKHFEYDARGNLVQETRGKDGKLKKTFYYNLQNQLIKVETNSEHETVMYQYDLLGRRIEKQDAFGTTTFLWADNQLVQEQRHTAKKTYLYEPGSFRPLAQIQDNQVYHYHLDHLGTPRELTNDEGKIVWKAKYKTYGNLALKEVEEVENNLRFQGQYFDEETGLHYNRFRYYSPESGQFINQDPIGLLGGLNNYQYAPNPVQWIDPWGLCKEDTKVSPQTTILGENMMERVIPFANKTGARTLPFGATREQWTAMTSQQRWKLNDGALRARINEGDNFRYIGIDPKRNPIDRAKFDLTGSELIRLQTRGVPYEVVSPAGVMSVLSRP